MEYIITGARGSGKTEQALRLAEKTGAIMIAYNTDYAKELARHLRIGDVEIQSFRWAMDGQHLSHGENYVIDEIGAFIRLLFSRKGAGNMAGFSVTTGGDEAVCWLKL